MPPVSPSSPRECPVSRLSDDQLATALAEAEGELRAAQARAGALRSEQWRRRGRMDAPSEWPLRCWGFGFGLSVALAGFNLVTGGWGYGPTWWIVALPLFFVLPYGAVWLVARRQARLVPEQRAEIQAAMRELWSLVRRPLMQSIGLGFGLGLGLSQLLFGF